MCGAELLVASNEKRSTIGAVIDADGRRYGLTVSHVFNEGASDSSDDDDEGIDEGPCSDTEESEEWTSEYDEEEFKACMENEASFPGPPDEPAPTSTSTALPLMLGVEASKGLLWKCQLTNDTGPEWSSMDQQLDYALVELGEYEYRATNGSLSPLRMLDSDGALSTRVSSFPPTPDHDLIVVTRRGSLRAVGRESGSRNEWAIQLKHGEFGEFVCPLTRSLEEVISCLELGDSGSLIVDATDGCVYGILISGDPLFGNGYIAPAIGIKDDLQRTFRANLQYGEEVRNLWPSRQFEVPLLPERYEMLPSKFKVLLDAARAGDFRAISRLIDSDAAQENQKTEQKKPLVEAAKRYKALIPISNVVNATSSTNEARLESPVRQLAEFYRNASRSGFRGEEADLDAKSSFLRILLARGVDPKESADIEGTALHQAAEDGNLELVKVLVTHLEDTTYVNLRRHNCWSPLHLAVREGHDDIVDFLIMNGADIAALNGSEDTKQDTVLQIAAWQGRSSVVRTLLDHKAVSVNDNGRFGGPLRAAAISASRLYHEEMSRIEQNGRGNSSRSSLDEMLVERQARDELFAIAKRSHQPASDASLAKTDPSGTVLSGSAVLQSVSDVLVDFRNLLRSPYQTPYTTILAYGSTIFELLLANEASQTFEGSDKDLEEAFFVAAEEGPSLLVRVLDDVLSKKLSPTLMREKRSKALCLAASAGDLSAIEILTRKGVDLNFKDDDGWTALRKYTHIRLWLQFSFSLFLTGISPLYLMFP